jgi:hypothetical protein
LKKGHHVNSNIHGGYTIRCGSELSIGRLLKEQRYSGNVIIKIFRMYVPSKKNRLGKEPAFRRSLRVGLLGLSIARESGNQKN